MKRRKHGPEGQTEIVERLPDWSASGLRSSGRGTQRENQTTRTVRIAGDDGVSGHQRDCFERGLSEEDAVERVAVNSWQEADGEHMITRHGQLAVAIFEELAAQDPGVSLKIIPSEPVFDRNLPQVHHAEIQVAVGILSSRACGIRQQFQGAIRN